MKSLFEFITEAGIKNQRDILCKQDGDCWITPTGNTITMFPIAASTNKHYDVVLAICDTRAPEITSGNLVISDLKNIKCRYLIGLGPEQANHMFDVRLKWIGEGKPWKSPWTWGVDLAVGDMSRMNNNYKGQTFFGGKFINDADLTIQQVDEFFKNNDVEHLIAGYATGKRDLGVKYHMREIVPGGKNKYTSKPIKVDDIAKELGMPEDPKSNWLAMF